MGYRSSSPARPAKNEFIVGVGWHAYVNWLPAPGRPGHPVPMLDGAGNQIGNDLADGQEVEILSWRPRSRDGLSYQIRRLSDGSEWWIAAKHLRRGRTPKVDVSVAESPSKAATADRDASEAGTAKPHR